VPDAPKQAAAVASEPGQRYFSLLLAFAAALRLYDLGGKQLWVDEIMQAMATSPRLSLLEVLRAATGHVGMAPLDYIIQHYVAVALGTSEFALRLPAAVFGTATVAAVYCLFRKLLDSRVAFLCAALYAVYPLHHHYSQAGRPYALFVLLTVLSWLAYCRVLEHGSRSNWILYAAANTVLLYSQYFGMFVLASQALTSLAMLSPRLRDSSPFSRKIDLRFLVIQTFAIVASAALLAPWVVYAIGGIRGTPSMPAQFGPRLALSFIQELGDGSHPLAWILIFLAVLGARKLEREKSHGLLWLLLIWLIMPIPLIFFLLWLRDYFFAIRHFLFITPALFALVSLGITDLSEQWISVTSRQRVKWATAGIVAGISLLVIGLHVPDTREDFRGAAQYLSQNVAPGDIVIAPHIEGILSYYYPRILEHVQPLAALTNRPRDASSGAKIILVDTAYMPVADRQFVQSALRTVPARETIHLQKVEIAEVSSR